MVRLKNKTTAGHDENYPAPKTGFTLIEVLVVAGIIGYVTTFFIANFSRSRINFNEASEVLKSNFRIAQTKAISSTKFDNKIRCGYGIRYVNNTSYAIYVGENATTHNCPAQNRDYNPISGNPDTDANVETVKFADPRIEFKTIFRAIYFEPPDPKTFVIDSGGTVHNEPNYSLGIVIGKIGGTCPQDCRTITISTSGKIE